MTKKTRKAFISPAVFNNWGTVTIQWIAVFVFCMPGISFGQAAPESSAHTVVQTEGEYLYKVTLLRAAPGHFNELISALGESFEVSQEAGDRLPFWIRHTQGDHWDFMLIYPMEDYESYFSSNRIRQRERAWTGSRGLQLLDRLSGLVAYQEEWCSRSIPYEELAGRFDGQGFFHVEMFAGLPGKRAELLEQRRMENRYYEHLDRQQNVLFVREAGSNWDAMTIGFHPSLQAFAEAEMRFSAEEQNEAALAAGFEGVDAIGPYLRSLLSYHNDTLGVRAN